MSLYGFVSDKCLMDPGVSIVNLETLNIPCGYLDREMVEHFVEPLEVLDTRQDRLPIVYRPSTYIVRPDTEYVIDAFNTVLPAGVARMGLYPDNTVTYAQYSSLDYINFTNEVMPTGLTVITPNDFKVTFDSTAITVEERTAIDQLNQDDFKSIFNIIEYLVYGIIPDDTVGDINNALIADNAFLNYVPTTVRVSELHSVAALFGSLDIHRFVPHWVEFEYNKAGIKLKFTIWIDRNAFRVNYPLFTVVATVPPINLETLLDPSSLVDPLDAIALSRKASDDIMIPELTDNDQSGSLAFTTRHIFQEVTHMLTFNIVYRGRRPNDLEVRRILVDYLLASGIGSEGLWELRLPDIFVKNQMYLIPLWDEQTILTNSDIYPSLLPVNRMTAKFNQLIAGLRTTSGDFELMTVAYDKIFIGVKPDDINEVSTMLELHPTYRDFSTTDPGFQEMSNADKDFATKINNLLAIAAGQINNTMYGTVDIANKHFITLVLDGTAYNVLTKASYLTNLTA